MIDMAGDMRDLIQAYQQLKANPQQFIAQKFNIQIPQNMSNSNDIMQYLLNTGQRTQNQVNQVMQMKNMFRR